MLACDVTISMAWGSPSHMNIHEVVVQSRHRDVTRGGSWCYKTNAYSMAATDY